MNVLQPGAVFGRDFKVVRALRAGGMGAVYIVDQLSTGKARALKVMAPELTADPVTRERFVLEARAASGIESDHVVEVVTAGVDEESGCPFLVMELLKGEDLGDALARTGPLPQGDVAEILRQVGHALTQAHQQGIVHRDLKPENIFLAASRRPDVTFTAKILDFGIAKLVADGQKTGTQPLGTPLFMSPEQTDRKGRICPATDVWALGLITFLLLTGRYFWLEVDGSLPQLLREICVEPIPYASQRARDLGVVELLPRGFDAWFARCVNRDIDARFADAGEAVAAFLDLVATDAPRGVLSPVMTTGELGVKVQTGAGVDTGAATVAVAETGAGSGVATNDRVGAEPLVRSGRAAGGGGKAWLAIPALALVAAGAFFVLRGRSEPPAPASSSAPSAAHTSTEPATSAAMAKEPSCPEGMVKIPGGKMFMGARDLTDDAKPPHEVTISSFCLDKTEVTTAAYMACAKKGECERPLESVSWKGLTKDKKERYSPLCNGAHEDKGDHPINCVAWPMADNYCRKNGKRLPTEAEWEFAARGSSQRHYPWGDEEPDETRLNACGAECAKWAKEHGETPQMMFDGDDGYAATAPVGSFPRGQSTHGVMDLAGNVWEWTADYYGPYPSDPVKDPKGPSQGTERVARGGAFNGFMADWARPAYRWKTDPETYNHGIGFRCAAELR